MLKSVLTSYARVLRPHLGPFVGIIIVIVAATLLNLLTPWYYKQLFDILATHVASAPETRVLLLRTIGLLLAINLVGWLLWRVSGFASAWFYPKMAQEIYDRSFAYLIRHSYGFFSNSFAGGLVRRLARYVNSFNRLGDHIQWRFVPTTVTLVGVVVALWYRRPELGLLVLAWAVVFIAVNWVLTIYKLRIDLKRSAADSRITATTSDMLTNSISIKLFSGYEHEEGLLRGVVGNYAAVWKRSWNFSEWIMTVQVFLMISIEIGLLWLGVSLWTRGILTVGDFALLQSYMLKLFDQVWDLGKTMRDFYEDAADAEEMTQILDTPHEVKDKPRVKALAVQRGEIEFNKVTFTYRQTRKVLNDFSLTIASHEKVALVGPSGAGKSTVTKLLFRFFDLDAGHIFIDGQDIANVKTESLWNAIALVPQEPVLFHRTLMENIRYGRREATDAEVKAAAKKANCHDFILSLPDGYNTFVGERGIKLSGGERQRVAIARAILKDAPVLVLDEATSSLDSASEQMIQGALAELMRGKTTIVIAHRLSTIMQMDRIVVIEKGRVADQGTHEELLTRRGTYAKLWKIQAGGFRKP